MTDESIQKAQQGILRECPKSQDFPKALQEGRAAPNLSSQFEGLSKKFSLQAYAVTDQDLGELLDILSNKKEDQLNSIRLWWVKRLNSLHSTLFNTGRRYGCFLETTVLGSIFSEHNLSQADEKFGYENAFRRGYISRFAELVMESVGQKSNIAEYQQHFETLISESNSIIYDILTGLRIEASYEAIEPLLERLLDNCAEESFNINFKINNLENFAEKHRLLIQKIYDNQLEGESPTLIELDPNLYWQKLLKQKIPDVVKLLLSTDKLTGKSLFELIVERLKLYINLQSLTSDELFANLSFSILAFCLGKLNILNQTNDTNLTLYLSKLPSALQGALFDKQSKLQEILKGEIKKQRTLIEVKQKLSKNPSDDEASSVWLKKLKTFINEKISSNKKTAAELVSILRSVYEFLFSKIDGELEKGSLFFINHFMQEQIGKPEEETWYDFCNKYQFEFLHSIIDYVVHEYAQKVGIDPDKIQQEFLEEIKLEHKKKAFEEISMLSDLFKKSSNYIDELDELDSDSKDLKEGLKIHLQDLTKEYVRAYSEQCWLPPAAKFELITKTSLEQVKFVRGNETIAADPKKKSFVAILFSKVWKTLTQLFYYETPTALSESQPSTEISVEKAALNTNVPKWQKSCGEEYAKAATPFIKSHPPLTRPVFS